MLAAWGFSKVTKAAMTKNLARPYPHNVLTLMPGGIREMFYGTEVEQIFLKSRFGFAKLALTTGASLVPAYCLGANQCYTRYSNQHSLLAKVSSKIQTSLVFWTGAFGIPVSVKCTIQLTYSVDRTRSEMCKVSYDVLHHYVARRAVSMMI
jgi:hypothetical protein